MKKTSLLIVSFVAVLAFLYARSRATERAEFASSSPTLSVPSVPSAFVSPSSASRPASSGTALGPAPTQAPARKVSAGAALGTAFDFGQEKRALKALNEASVKLWTSRRDAFSSNVRTLVRGDLPLKSGESPRSAANDFVKTYARDLFGVDPSRLEVAVEDITNRTKISYAEKIDGVPVYGATLTLFYENGSLTRVQNDLPALADPGSGGAPSNFTAADAFTKYRDERSANAAVTMEGEAETLLYPQGRSLFYAYHFVTSETSKDDGARVSREIIYDAENPHIIKSWDGHIH